MLVTKKTLIVVYKDEMLMNQLKKLVESHDDSGESVVGTRDDSINIVSWTEKIWLGNKKAGNIQDKILFLGEIKGTDKLIPLIDPAFDEFGVKYGWAGNQAVVFADPKALTSRENYDAFLMKLSDLPVPEFLKTAKAEEATDVLEQECDKSLDVPEKTCTDTKASDENTEPEKGKKQKRPDVLQAAKKSLSSAKDAIGKTGHQVAAKSEEMFRNKSLMKRQMMFYGVMNLYYSGLETFINQ